MDWKPHTFHLFISHVSSNYDFASTLAIDLYDRCGIHGFVAHEDINPTSDWQNEIEDALNTMDALLALLTVGFSQSTWCNQEIGWTLGAEKLCVAMRDGEDPPGFAGRSQAVRMGDRNTARISREIFKLLAQHDSTAEQISRVTASRLLNATSWENVRHFVDPCLAELTVFTDEIIDDIERSFTDNSSVRESYYAKNARRILSENGRPNPPLPS